MAESPVAKEGGDSVATPQGANPEPGTQRVGSEPSRDVEVQRQIDELARQRAEVQRQIDELETQRADVQQQIDELKDQRLEQREKELEQREKHIYRWLAVIGLVLALSGFFGLGLTLRESAEPPTPALQNVENEVAEDSKDKTESDARGVRAVGQTNPEPTELAPEQETQATENSASSPEGSLVDVAVAVARAITIQQEGDKQEAIELWRAIAVISEGQDDNLAARAWFSRALLNQAADREQAIDDYGKAIELNSDFAEAYSNRGAARNELGRNAEAIADYGKAIELDQDDDAAYSNRGNAKTDLGRPKEAIADFDEAIKLNPDSFYAYVGRGNAQNVLGRHDDAIDDFTAALELNPGYVNAHVGRGIANYYLGHQEQAWGDFDEAIKLKPELEHRLSVFQEAL